MVRLLPSHFGVSGQDECRCLPLQEGQTVLLRVRGCDRARGRLEGREAAVSCVVMGLCYACLAMRCADYVCFSLR